MVTGLLDVLPAWVGILLFTLVPALLAAAAHAVFRRFVPAKDLIPHHDVAGFIVSVVGVLYAVVLGFIVVTVWASFDAAQRNADAEAGNLGELFVLSATFPEPARTNVRRELSDYAYEVRDVEWPLLVQGQRDERAREFLLRAFESVASMKSPQHDGGEVEREATIRQAAFTDFHELGVHRRQRLLDSSAGLIGVLYFPLVLGGLMVLAFAFMFGVENPVPQLVMTGILAGLIGLLIGLIAEFDRPYASSIRVSPEAFNLVIESNHMARYRSPHARAGPR